MAKKAEAKPEEPKLPGIDIKPLKWLRVKIYAPDCVGGTWVEYDNYLLTRPLTSEEAEKLFRESKLPALKAAREILDRDIADLEKQQGG